MLPILVAAQILATAVQSRVQFKPLVEPALFGLLAPNDMSNTLGAAFTPDGNTVYFTKSAPGGKGLTIFVSHEKNAHWSAPEVASFSGIFADADPAVTPDGSALIFSSQRPPRPDIFSLYEVFLHGPRTGTVVPLPNTANEIGDQFYASVSSYGTVYFTVNTNDGYRLYRVASVTEQNSAAIPLVFPGDAKGMANFDETVAPDGRFMVFASDRVGAGASDLYVSLHREGRWCAPERLPAPINATAQMATGLSPDGRMLYFASYRTDLKMPTIRPMNTAEFQAMLARYRNNSLHTYRADIGAWLDEVTRTTSC